MSAGRTWLAFTCFGVAGAASAFLLWSPAPAAETAPPAAQEPSAGDGAPPSAGAPSSGEGDGASAAPEPSAGEAAPPSAGAPSSGVVSAADRIAEQVRARRAAEPPPTFGQRAVSFLGLFGFVALCWLLSSDRRSIDWRLVAWGLGLQLLFGVLVLRTAPGHWVFEQLNRGVMALLSFTEQGSAFLFRSFVSGKVEPPLVNFVFSVLPTIIFLSSLMTVLYHLGIMQRVVHVFTVGMQKTMRTSGAETLSTAANIFVGQTEAPLVIKPYVKDMTQSELMAVMVGGFANTAGGVLAAYVSMLAPYFPDIAGHLIAQSVMSAPAALVCAKIVRPERESPVTAGRTLRISDERLDANVLDAAARGASEGMSLALNVAAMLLAFIALIALGNSLIGMLGGLLGWADASLEAILGVVTWPLAWLMGVPAHDCLEVGKLIGIKTVLNEFVAYLRLAEMLGQGSSLSYRSTVIASYALSGFANFSSIAIQIGGISGLAPERRHDLARLGLLAMLVGSIATFMTATTAGFLMP